jgi:hypothetical protein
MYSSEQFKQTIGLPEYANLKCQCIGLDSPEHCFDKKHFDNYGQVEYKFNEIGYRHTSINNYCGNEILAIGDSFTVGLGVNQQHLWTELLSSMLGYPVLNFSLNGASNDWICRKTSLLLKYFQPKCIIFHYSFTHRRERSYLDWTDVERTQCDPLYSDEENLINWQQNYNKLLDICKNISTVHTAIPNWHPGPVENVLVPTQIDFARDGFHYGPQTHRRFATSLLDVL